MDAERGKWYAKARTLQKHLDIKDRKYRRKNYKQCFVGKAAIPIIINLNFASTEQEAVDFGNQLMKLNIIKHVERDHTFKNAKLFYEFNLKDQTPTGPNCPITESHRHSITTNPGTRHNHHHTSSSSNSVSSIQRPSMLNDLSIVSHGSNSSATLGSPTSPMTPFTPSKPIPISSPKYNTKDTSSSSDSTTVSSVSTTAADTTGTSSDIPVSPELTGIRTRTRTSTVLSREPITLSNGTVSPAAGPSGPSSPHRLNRQRSRRKSNQKRDSHVESKRNPSTSYRLLQRVLQSLEFE